MQVFPPMKTVTTVLVLMIMAFVSLATAPAGAETINEDIKIIPDDGLLNELFGSSTAVGSGVVAVAASFGGDNGYASGSVYLFNSTTGAPITKVLPSDGQELDQFGYDLAIGDGILVVGSVFDDDFGTDSGSVYLFQAATGQYLSKLNGNDIDDNDRFGVSVAIDNGIIAVGALMNEGANDSWSGAAYLFNAVSGAQIAKLLPADGAMEDFFGTSVGISNNIVVVGSPWDDDNGSKSGSAYLFNATTGAQITKILPDDGHTGDNFGHSVAIDGGVIVVGAYHDDDQGSNCGSAYLFDATTGAQIAKILPGDVYSNEEFGHAVDIDGGVIIVGAKFNDGNGSDSGSAYLFDATTAGQLDMLAPSDGALSDLFGTSVAINNGVIAVGAVGDDDNGSSSGSAYIFDIGGATTPAMPVVGAGLTLMPNHPNPFNPSTTISYSVENDGYVELTVFSARGTKVRTLVSGWQASGENHAVVWDGRNDQGQVQSSGVYFARLSSQENWRLQKMVLLK